MKRINALHPLRGIRQIAIYDIIDKTVKFSDGYKCFISELRDWEEV